MTILDGLISTLPDDIPVREVLVGAHWTVVCSRYCRMAATLLGNHSHGHMQVRDVDNLSTKSVRKLAEYAYSRKLQEASIGLAAINSALNMDESLAVEINASEVLAIRGRGKNVALIGYFPLIPQLRQAAYVHSRQGDKLTYGIRHASHWDHPFTVRREGTNAYPGIALKGYWTGRNLP